jgi:hypothetical protein
MLLPAGWLMLTVAVPFCPRAAPAFQEARQSADSVTRDSKSLSGIVVDAATRSGIPGAVIDVTSTTPDGPAKTQIKARADGRFTFSVPLRAEVSLSARASGYVDDHKSNYVEIGSTETADTDSLRLELRQACAIEGILTDFDTGRPVQGLQVSLRSARYLHGHRILHSVPGGATSGKDGSFVIANIPSGEYFLETGTKPHLASGASEQASEPEYEHTWSPGEPGSSEPILVAGGTVKTGTIRLRPRPLASLLVTVNGDGCREGGQYDVVLEQQLGDSETELLSLTLDCEAKGKLGALSPGTYELVATAHVASHDPNDIAAVGSTPVIVEHKDISAEVSVSPPVKMAGDISGLPDGQISNIRIKLWPADSNTEMSWIPVFDAAPVNSDGTFSSPVFLPPGGKVEVVPFGVPRGAVVESVKYNDALYDGATFVGTPFSVVQHVSIKFSRAAGSVHGTVKTGLDSPASGAAVLLVPLQDARDYPTNLYEYKSTADGKFAFDGIPAGKYFLFAVGQDSRDDLERPGRLLSAAGQNDPIEVTAGGTIAVNLALSRT